VGIRKDIKKYIDDLKDENISWKAVYTKDVVQNLEEILRKNKKTKKQKRLRNEYIMVKALDINDDGDTWEAIRDGHGVPPIGYRYIKVKK
jgi:transcription antitermination factor NusG